ncbi:MAG: hypothetical protein QUS14_08495, partial [Pyrinomonadaceae bacterium]|nr:hypothetical protein [Pyrinomonadaceae bacterium]
MRHKVFIIFAFLLAAATSTNAQRTEITISLSEQFFDTVIDALFQNGAPPEFSIAGNASRTDFVPDDRRTSVSVTYPHSFTQTAFRSCRESIRLSRENNGCLLYTSPSPRDS